ncbi:MAG: hypothetical protein JF587_23275 [Catenulisporales bacterium]|nr:hypothetical protein [Catenulisporales bacterium]
MTVGTTAETEGCRSTASRVRRWVAAALAVVTAAGTAACAGPPTGGDVKTTVLSQGHNNVLIFARGPDPGMSPTQLVSNFLQALTGDQKDPSFIVAQEYLTADGRKLWAQEGLGGNAPTKIVDHLLPVLDDQGAAAGRGNRPAPAATASPKDGDTATVTVQSDQRAELDPYGFYRIKQGPLPVKFDLTREQGGWRINDPPPFRMIDEGSFKRVYQINQSAMPIYLPASGSLDTPVDQVYLTQATGKVDYTYDALARAVLHGRGDYAVSRLQPDGPVKVNAGVAVVKLKVPPGGPPDLTEVQQALRLTFRDAAATQQLAAVTPPVTGIQVTYTGCTPTACGVQDLNKDNAVPPVYWVCPQASNESAVVFKQLSANPLLNNGPSVCPPNSAKAHSEVDLSGLSLVKDAPMAVKRNDTAADGKTPSSSIVAAVLARDAKGAGVVVVGDKNSVDHRVWYQTVDPSKITDLEWDPVDGSLWVVDGHTLVHVRDPGGKEPSSDSWDALQDPPGGVQITRFKPAPDGSRAVIVTGQTASGSSAGPWPAQMVAIDRTGEVPMLSNTVFPLLSSDPGDTLLSASLASATDAAWADGRTVVLLGVPKDSNTVRLLKVYADGSQDSAISAVEDAQPAAKHIAAATSVTNGRHMLWVFSDGTGPAADPGNSYVYFKSHGATDISNQELGSTPVVATSASG